MFSFVTACRTAAQGAGLDVHPLDDIKAWHLLWRAARDTQPDSAPSSVPSVPLPAAGQEAPEEKIEPMSREYLLRVFGRSGIRVLFASDAHDPRHLLRLAVIALLRGWPDDAHHWLARARAAGHPDAATLSDHPQSLRFAAKLAYSYGREFQLRQPVHLSLAMFFYRLASDGGHVEAAYQLGLAHRSRGEPWVAASWFRRAALHGHRAAMLEFDGATDQLTQSP
ncbi:hypothetical protein AB0I81_10080 [Nonomuraea sp. NPDC050404]|uniref:hypothetical protein n=1 Tax=Nonomuraea sp. NPDC050404 TaxID=3155783 RepID=UPI0033CF04BD